MGAMTFSTESAAALPLYIVDKDALDALGETLDEHQRQWLKASSFKAGFGQALVLPSPDGGLGAAIAGLGSATDRARGRFALASVRRALPGGVWRFETDLGADDLAEAALGWLLGGYTFGRYKTAKPPEAELVAPGGIDAARIERIAAGEALTRDLINTPASDMGPDELEAAARKLADEEGADFELVIGDQLRTDFPLIHAVGRASDRAPRLIELNWNRRGTGPSVTLVGKGVCFDTGGLNLKPGSSMGLMKKDMGGAANVLGLAQMLVQGGAPFDLRVLIPAVENSVSGASFRPGDVLTSRKGLTVEINNTDAEGRLVLADALALADESEPDLIISMATLTGAARVAVGPDLAPFYATEESHARRLAEAAEKVRDPVWRMPFWDPYEQMIEPKIADLDNAPSGGFAGSITAALFLRRFVERAPYMHFDIYGWSPSDKPGRPKGGVGQGTRALHEALPGMLSA